MLAANVCAADLLARHKQPALYRIHEGPSPERLANVHTLLKSLGLNLEGGEQPSSAQYAELLRKIVGRPDQQLLQTVLLRSMQQAVYSPHNVGHFGLSYEAYAHFTSPIRRYPDLLVHRAIKAVLSKSTYTPTIAAGDDAPLPMPRGKAGRMRPPPPKPAGKQPAGMAVWEKLGLICSANERRADDASRDVEAWLKSYYMRERVGETFSGTIGSVVPFGVFVVLDDLFVEGLVHVSELGSEYFTYNEALHELRGERTGLRYRLADRVTVQVARVDLEARRIEFRLVREQERKALIAGETETARKDGKDGKRKGESVEERRARVARVQARKGRDGDTRTPDRARPGKRGGGQGVNRGRVRGRR